VALAALPYEMLCLDLPGSEDKELIPRALSTEQHRSPKLHAHACSLIGAHWDGEHDGMRHADEFVGESGTKFCHVRMHATLAYAQLLYVHIGYQYFYPSWTCGLAWSGSRGRRYGTRSDG
jgi:hypothetical protein